MITSLMDAAGSVSLPTLNPAAVSLSSRAIGLPSIQKAPGGQRGGSPGLTPEEEQYWLRELAKQSGQFIESLGLVLDTPGAIARGYLAGQPNSGFNFDTDARTSGIELLDGMGIAPQNPYLRTAAGLGAEIVTDPLFWLSGPIGAMSKAGAAAKQAGVLKNAPVAYARKYGTDAAEGTMRGQYIKGLFEKNYVPKTAGNYQAVTPAGQRLAQSKVTLEDVVNASSDPTEALRNVTTKLGSAAEYQRLKDQTLGGMFGLNVGPINMAFTPPGSDKVMDAMDYLGARARFSYPGRLATGLFSKASGGAVDTGEQIAALRANALEDMYRVRGQTEATRHNLLLTKIALPEAAQRLLGADTLYSPQGNDMLVRLVEGHGTATDQQILSMTPGLQPWLDSWEQISNRQFAERNAMGLTGNFYKDEYGTKYNPRYGDEFAFDEAEQGTGRLLYDASEAEAYGRRDYLKTPGGTDDLRQISLLPEIIEYSKPNSGVTDEQAATVIMDWFKNKYPTEAIGDAVDRPGPNNTIIKGPNAQVLKIARTMVRRAQDLPDGTPVFAAHPANTQARRIIGHEVNKSRAIFLLESLSEAAVEGAKTQQAGRYRNLAESWDEIGTRAGFQNSDGKVKEEAAIALKNAISKATGVAPDQIDLTKYSVPERVVRRLQKVADFYAAPAAQKEVAGFLDGWTKLFKGFVLATPRRFVRDAYSNAVSGFLETGNGPRQLAAMWNASKIVNGDYAGAMQALRSIPRYSGLADDAIKDAFIMDVGGNGVLSGLQSSELLSSARSGEMGQLIPGSTPISIGKGLAQLVPDASTPLSQRIKNFGSIYGVTDQYDTQNPILRASSTINDTVDSVGRLGTFIHLLQQGASPAEAADRVKRALVDYQSLTLTERKWMRTIFPWWAYNSRIGKYAAESLMERPGGAYGQMIRASNTIQESDEDNYITEQLRQKFAVRMPDSLTDMLGLTQPDTKHYITDIDLPGIDVLNLLDPYGVQGTVNNLASQMAPPLQGFMSLATGRDLFFDRPLDETTTPADRVYTAVTGDPRGLSPAAKVLAGLIPGTQVPMAFAGTLVDPRIESFGARLAKAGLNVSTGFKINTQAAAQELNDIQRQIGRELDPITYTFQKAYIPEALQPTMTPRDRKLYALSQEKAEEALKLRERQRRQERMRKLMSMGPIGQ